MDADLRRHVGPPLAQVLEGGVERLDETAHRQARRAHIRLREIEHFLRHRHLLCQSPWVCCLVGNTQGGV